MGTPNHVSGRAYITVDGQRLDSKEGSKLIMGGKTREPVMSDDGTVDFMEKPVPGGVECTVKHKAGTSIKWLQSIANATITFETDSGRQFILRGAFVQNSIELANGEVSLQFASQPAEEV